MADKDLTIKITTTADTSGADAAAASLKKVESAANTPYKATDLTELNERMENIRKRAEYGAQEAENLRKAGDEAAASAPKLDKLVSFERLEALGRIGRETERFGKEIAKLGPEGEAAARTLETLGSSITGFAEGMRMGGPIGAVVGAGLALLKKPYDDMIESTENARRAEENLEEAIQNSINRRQELASKQLSSQIIENLNAETESAKGLSRELEESRRIRAAKEQADDAVQANLDAAAIARGETPQIDAARRKAERDKRHAEEKAQDLAEAAAKAQAAAEQARNSFPGIVGGETAKELETKRATEAAIKKQEKDAEELARRARSEAAILPEKNRAIDATMYGQIEAVERERAAAEAVRKRREDDAEAERTRSTGPAMTEAERNLNASGRSFGRRASSVAGSEANGIINAISGQLADGTNAKEIDGIAKQFGAAIQALGGNTASALGNMLKNLQDQAKKIATLEAQMKNNR